MKIFKYTLQLSGGPQSIVLPVNSTIRHADMQGDKPTLWIEVNFTQEEEIRHFAIFGTGNEVQGTHIATVLHRNGLFVWHIYEQERTIK